MRRAIHHGVWLDGRLIGYMRALRGDEPGGMMLDHDFREALTDPSYGPMLRRFYGLPMRPLNAQPYTFADGTAVNVDHASIADLRAGIEQRGLLSSYDAFRARYGS